MSENWREFLYPLGFLAGLAFGGRFILQWLKSEIRKKSIVTPTFWKLSLLGNSLLFVHSFIQMQFHVCVIQVINGVISWRNLNLMEPNAKHLKTRSVILLLMLLLATTILAFVCQGFYSNNEDTWFRIPRHSWNLQPSPIGTIWHFLGILGLVLFNSRFWVQWWHAEKTKASSLGYSFWWISLAGAFCSILYFIRIQDMVNLIGPAIGIIPYIRNLMLLSNTKSAETKSEPS